MSKAFGWMTAAALFVAATVAWAEEAEKPLRTTRHFRAGPVTMSFTSDGGGGAIAVLPLGEYWIGVECRPIADATLRSQLKLPDGQGLVVLGVVPDAPAAKAGVREHDILLQAAGKPVAGLQDLVAAVEKVKDQKLALELLRGGQKTKVEVQPAKRPAEATLEHRRLGRLLPPDDADVKSVEKWMERVMPEFRGQGPFQFHILRPGAILPPGAGGLALPEGTTVVITRSGAEPAKIVVEKGKDRWEVTEKELDQLPADVRGQVERMLSPWHALGHRIGAAAAEKAEAVQRSAVKQAEEFQKGAAKQLEEAQKNLERQMRELDRRMEQMKKSLEQMEKSAPKPKGV